MKKHPKSAAVQDVAATVYLQSGRYDDAFTAIRNADRYAEDQGQVLLEFGKLALKPEGGEPVEMERARVGVRALKRVEEAHPGTPIAPEAAVLVGEGLVSVARTQEDSTARAALLQEAVAALTASIQKAPSEAQQRDALALKGMIEFEDLHQDEAALATFQDLIRRQKENGEPHHVAQVQAGTVLAAMGRMDEARRVARPDSRGDAETRRKPGIGSQHRSIFAISKAVKETWLDCPQKPDESSGVLETLAVLARRSPRLCGTFAAATLHN